MKPLPLEDIVLDVQANQWERGFHLAELKVNGLEADYVLNRNRLHVSLAEALPAGCWLEISLKFRLQPSAIRDGLRSYRGFFGYSSRQLNLGHFLPTVAARLNEAWRLHEPAGIGEQIVYDVADWAVKLRGRWGNGVAGAGGAGEGYATWRWNVEYRVGGVA